MGALDGYRVVDLTSVGPGQFCTALLGDMGADVIVIERPGGKALGGERHHRSPYLQRNKRSLTLDLKRPAGQDVLRRLAAGADVLIEGMRPGVTTRLGADYATLSSVNPRLVYCSMSGYGQDGPHAQLAGHDLNYVAFAGLLDLFDTSGGPPAVPPNVVADYGGAALHAVVGTLLALLARERTGAGQHVDISYLDTTVALLGATTAFRQYAEQDRYVPPAHGVFSGRFPYYAIYETGDGRFLSVGCLEPPLWANLCRAVGAEELVDAAFTPADLHGEPGPAHARARARLQELFRTHTRDEWFALLAEHDACVAPVNSVEEVFRDPQLLHRGMVRETRRDDGSMGRELGIAIGLSATPGSVRLPPPDRGEHADAILGELGFDRDGVAELRADGVV